MIIVILVPTAFCNTITKPWLFTSMSLISYNIINWRSSNKIQVESMRFTGLRQENNSGVEPRARFARFGTVVTGPRGPDTRPRRSPRPRRPPHATPCHVASCCYSTWLLSNPIFCLYNVKLNQKKVTTLVWESFFGVIVIFAIKICESDKFIKRIAHNEDERWERTVPLALPDYPRWLQNISVSVFTAASAFC